MGYTLKTKSHKGQESRTRSQGPGAIDQEPRTKSQAYMHAWSQTKRLRPACRRLRCTNIYAIFSIHSIGDKSKSAVSLRQRRSAGHADNPRALLPKVTRAAWPKWKLPYKKVYVTKKGREDHASTCSSSCCSSSLYSSLKEYVIGEGNDIGDALGE